MNALEQDYYNAVRRIAKAMNQPKEIDWEQRRWQLVCRITQGLLAGQHSWSEEDALELADRIIAKYRSETSENVKEEN